MRFGKTLTTSTYPPWRDKYINYSKLKSLLREDKPDDTWAESDEQKFSDVMFNEELDKVADFQESKCKELGQRVDAAFDKLKELAPVSAADVAGTDGTRKDDSGKNAEDEGKGKGAESPKPKGEITAQRLKELEAELDSIANEIKELQKYSNLNYTGFLKIVKKHDRKRGNRYRIRPFLQSQLHSRPFNSEQVYSPMLNKMSLMYYAIRQHLEENNQEDVMEPVPTPMADKDSMTELRNGERYTAHKFWVHPENLLEVKTFIMRRLPQLVYSASSAKTLDGSEDPSITSLYFDNSQFDLYLRKVERQSTGDTRNLRLRWIGHLSDHPEIYLEQKTLRENGSSEEERFTVKDKYVKPFLDGEYHMEKTIAKMQRQGQKQTAVDDFKTTVDEMQKFVRDDDLQPVLRANYKRTAFQKPADDRIRISIDTELAFVREDALDSIRPCRDPADWHRRDIDDRNVEFPFELINKSEVSIFPYAVLEIKLKEDGTRKRPAWIEDLMSSHLVHAAPRFSKFTHGVAVLFDDYVNRLPYWLSELETDIRREPEAAFEEEEQRRARRAADEQVVGSFLGAKGSGLGSYKPSKSSPLAKSVLAERGASLDATSPRKSSLVPGQRNGGSSTIPEDTNGEDGAQQSGGYGTLSSVIPSFTNTRYALHKKSKRAQSYGPVPEGVKEPEIWIKNMGPLKIEPKVWLANERTFLKWQHISVLLGGLAVALYTASGGKDGGLLAELMGIVYIGIAVFTGLWGWGMYKERRQMIMERSGRDFDNMLGPMVISIALGVALIVNFTLQFNKAARTAGWFDDDVKNQTLIAEELLR